MANGYSLSSDAEDFFDKVVKAERDRGPTTGMEEFTDSVLQQERMQTQQAAAYAKQFPPDTYAAAAKAAPHLPPDMAARNAKLVADIARQQAYQDLFDKSPKMRGYFANNPRDLPYANPDELDKYNGLNWAVRAFPQALSAGIQNMTSDYLNYLETSGEATPETRRWAESLATLPPRTFGNHGDWLSSGLVAAADSIPQMAASVIGGGVRGLQGAVVGGVGGAAVGSVVPGVGTLAGGAAGLGAGFRVGASYGALEAQIKLQTGNAFAEFKNFKDENGQPLDKETAIWAARFAGLGGGALETLGLSKTIGQVPGVGPLLGNFSKAGIAKLLKDKGYREAFTRFAKNLGEGALTEIGTEVLQEALTVFSGEVAKETSGQEFPMLTAPEITQRLSKAAITAAQVMTLLGPLTSGTRFAADLYEVHTSKRSNDRVKALAQSLDGDALIERAPAVAAKIIDDQANGQKVWLPGAETLQLFQDQNVDPYAVPIDGWRKKLDEAVASGGDVEITLGEFLAHLGRDPKANPLMDLVKTDPRDYTTAEIKEYSDTLDQMLGSELQRAEATAVEPKVLDTSISDAFEEQLKAAGVLPEAAKHYSTMLGAFFNTMGSRSGIDPKQLAQEYALEIQQAGAYAVAPSESISDPLELMQPAWHGTGKDEPFERFSNEYMGTGEGAQAFGWGLYFAEKRSIAEFYRNKLGARRFTYDGTPLANIANPQLASSLQDIASGAQTREQFIEDYKFVIEQDTENTKILEEVLEGLKAGKALKDLPFGEAFELYLLPEDAEGSANLNTTDPAQLQEYYNTGRKKLRAMETQLEETKEALSELEALDISKLKSEGTGRLYSVDLPEDDEILNWEKPVSQQAPVVQEAFQKLGVDTFLGWTSEETGETFGTGDPDFEVSGREAYEKLSHQLGSDRAASEALAKLGVAGHKFHDNTSRGKGSFVAKWKINEDRWKSQEFNSYKEAFEFLSEVQGWDMAAPGVEQFAKIEELPSTFNYVMYDDSKIKIREYFQDQRGSISFKDGQAVIKLFEKSDLSTLLHESGHFFLEVTRDLAQRSPEIAKDWEIIKKHLGVKGDTLTREQHEQFAREAETYFLEGRAPSAELRSAFEAFRRWLTFIYRSIKNLGGRLDPEIREVFDRMLSVERRVEDFSADSAYAPLFKSAEEMGVEPDAYLKYQERVDTLRAEAQDSARARIVGQASRLSSGWFRQVERELRAEYERSLAQLPPYSYLPAMRRGEFQINTKLFKEKYSEDAQSSFPRAAFGKDGFPPDVAAELLGYATADDMVYDFEQAPPIKEAARQAAREEMIRRYGEDFKQQDVFDLAVKRGMAEDARLFVLGAELKALKAKAGETVSENSPRQIAQQIARDTMYRKKFKDVNRHQTQSAVRSAAARAENAMIKGKWAEAADWKRKQLLAQALDNEAEAVQKQVDKIRDAAAKYSKTAPASIDKGTMHQIRELVERFEFTKVSLKKLARRESLKDYLERSVAEGFVTKVPDYLIRDSARMNYKELTVEQLLGLGDALDNLVHIGRLKNKLRIAGQKRDWNKIHQEALTSIRRGPTRPRKMKTYTEEEREPLHFLAGFHASLLKPEQLIEWLDMGDIAGPLSQYVFEPIATAQGKQNELTLQYNKALTDIFEGISSEYLGETVAIRSLRTNMSRQSIYAVALNLGNDSNRVKLMQGELWNENQVAEIISHLTKEDWDRIQKIWDLLDSLWPKIARLEQKLTGVAPPKVEGREFTNQYGTYRGGYYPVVYDWKVQRGLNILEDTTPGDQNPLERIFDPQQRYVRPGTSHKHTVARVATAKPIRLELAVLPSHLHSVIHDLTYREPVRAAYKILWDREISQAIIDREGEPNYQQLQEWLRSVATQRPLETDSWNKFIEHTRTGTTLYGLGFNVMTVIAQPLGFFNSLTKMPAKYLAGAIYQMARHPFAAAESVKKLSPEMRDRFNAQDRDIHDTVKKVSLRDTKLDKVRRYSLAWLGYADRYVSTATWLGAYEHYLSEHPDQRDLARQHADRTVRLSQGTGSVKDLAQVQNKPGVMRLMTMFYSAFSAIYNTQVDLTRKTKRDISAGAWGDLILKRLPQWIYLVVAPAILGAYVTGNGPEEDEDMAAWAARKVALYPLIGVPIVRDIVGAIDSGYRYRFSPAAKGFEAAVTGLAKLFGLVGDVAEGEQLEPWPVVKSTLTAGGIAFHVPLGEPLQLTESLFLGLANGDFEPKDLLIGRRDK